MSLRVLECAGHEHDQEGARRTDRFALNESLYWLRFAQNAQLTKFKDLPQLIDEADQLTAIVTSMTRRVTEIFSCRAWPIGLEGCREDFAPGCAVP